MKLKSISLLALASGLGLAMAACSGNNNPSGNASATPEATETGAATGAPAATESTAASSHAAQFLTDVIQTDNAEIRFGGAAETMGSTQAVKDFGKMLVDDHTKHKDKATQIATALNVPVPQGTTADADSEYNMATSMSGTGFDKDFLTAMVKGHQAAIDKFQMEAASSDPAQVTGFAKDSLPTLKKHLAKAQSLQK